MNLLDFFGKKQFPAGGGFEVTAEVHPFRLSAYKNSFVDLDVALANVSNQNTLTSLALVVPKELSLDKTGLSNQKELRLGEITSGDSKTTSLRVYATQRTPPGDYTTKLFVVSHYREYSNVLNQTRKDVLIRVV